MKQNKIPDSLKTIDLQAILRKRGIYTQQRMNKEAAKQLRPLAKQMLSKKAVVKKSQPRRHAQFTDEVVLAYWEKQIRLVEVLENKFEAKVEQFIDKMIDDFVKHLDSELPTEKRFTPKTKDYFDDNEDDLLVKAQIDFTPLLESQAILAGQEAYKLIGSDDVYLPYKLRETIAENVRHFTQSMIDTDREKLVGIITSGLEDGKSVPEIRNAIQADFDGGYSKMQAQRITRTEVLRASNQAALDAYEQSGVVEGKQWLTAGADDECAQYEGQIESLNGNFYNSENVFQDGDPPLHPNCKCVVLPVLINEKAYTPPVNQKLIERITELEAKADKRTKAFKELKAQSADDRVYMTALEKHLGIQ